MFLKVLSERKCVIAMPLTPQTKRFNTLEEEECSKGIERRTEVTEKLSSDSDRESRRSECFTEL